MAAVLEPLAERGFYRGRWAAALSSTTEVAMADLDKPMVCATCGWRGPIGVMKLSKHQGCLLDCPKCGSGDTYAADGMKDAEFTCPVSATERH
jgi:Zn finger protein HypA/HybF involved in hydrogenase expression